MNKDIITKRFEKASGTYAQEAVVQKQIAEKLYELLLPYVPGATNRILEIGCGTGFLSQLLIRDFNSCGFLINDLCPSMEKYVTMHDTPRISFIAGDAEKTDFPGLFDIIASSSAVQWFSDLPAFLNKAEHNLSPGGIIALSSFGADNFKEIKSITGSGLSYVPLREYAESHFQILQYREEHITLHFRSAREVLEHVRKTGVNGNHNSIWTKSRLTEFFTKYNELYQDDKGVVLTYHPVYLIAKKRQS